MLSKKSLIFALMLVAAPAVVHASPLLVLEKEKASDTFLINATFEVNRELGRAWLEISEISDRGSIEVGPGVEVIRKSVEGLSYDQGSNQVVYTHEGRSVVCANDEAFLFQRYLKETGDCPISISFENRTFDDGFNQTSRVVSKIVFDPQA